MVHRMKNRTLFSIAALALFAALRVAAATYLVETDHPDCLYQCGETATFTVTVLETNGVAATNGSIAITLDNFGPAVQTNAVFNLAEANPFHVSGSLSEPGFLRVALPNADKGPNHFSVGFEPERIVKGSPSPSDFDDFWAGQRQKLAREVPLDPQLERVPERCTEDFEFFRISFATFGRRVYGYLSIPTDKTKAPFPVWFGVNSAGFGNWTNDMQGRPDAIRAQFSVYTFPPDWRFIEIGLKEKFNAMNADCNARYGSGYATAGLAHEREDYFFLPVALGLDRAVDWIAARPDADPSRFWYDGTSQGGGFGFYLCGLNHHFTRGIFFVPAITDTMGWLAGRRSGWPRIEESARGDEARLEAIKRNAPYYDAANFASRIQCPVRVGVGFSDTTCPPCAVYAAYNEIKVADKGIRNGIGMTHGVSQEMQNELRQWLKGDEAK